MCDCWRNLVEKMPIHDTSTFTPAFLILFQILYNENAFPLSESMATNGFSWGCDINLTRQTCWRIFDSEKKAGSMWREWGNIWWESVVRNSTARNFQCRGWALNLLLTDINPIKKCFKLTASKKFNVQPHSPP